MSVNEQEQGGPIMPGSPLAKVLDDYPVPGLSTGFADRVLAAAEVRPAPLPALRRPALRPGWRTGRRIAIGLASFGALATAAAATGLLERLDITIPAPQTVWASITGSETAAAASSPKALADNAVPAPAVSPTPIKIVGPVDTPEELGEAFRRIDAMRAGRREERRQITDQRINNAIERRRAAGLPVPDAEQEARLRARIDEAQARREQLIDQRIEERRAEMQRKVDQGEALTREDILRPLREDKQALERRERIEKLRRMSPEERREALRQMPPEQRRALIDEYRARRSIVVPAISPASAPEPSPAE
ncbi:hypothetical protein [Porphyrobacter sp. ULC335]|uniref:hypothetical protein n=1 Tax=Porphyrobacter sp. ULC335 TaxID=2854260 RepID=UPI002220BC4A|nr:hypothetical protein [Porphyrobacter sp. ULC335]UYV14433.1 hypothetical protein KVF90_09635 [Porphyrobacter sp. ULC335]